MEADSSECSGAEIASLEELMVLIGRNRRFEIRQSENGASSSMENLVPPTSPSCLFNYSPAIEGQSIPVVSSAPVDEQVDLGKNLESSNSPSIQRDSVHHCGSQQASAAAGCEQPYFFLNDADSTTTSPESGNNEPTSPSSLLDEEDSLPKRS
ncbi:hypothetical protein HHI36_022187 [Cryptolaemus montrouzieri]|uniref:Uncharacterized protein n=1 Tax=Cryptolaemus montrouzieri TaxID=559131 RepID=A0ABD2MZ42_9CUCU